MNQEHFNEFVSLFKERQIIISNGMSQYNYDDNPTPRYFLDIRGGCNAVARPYQVEIRPT